MAATSIVGFSLMNAHSLVKQLDAMAVEVREVVAANALESGMKPVQAAVIANTPESSVTGSRKKQSTKTKQKWSGSKKLKSTIRSVVRKRKFAGITAGMIGLVGRHTVKAAGMGICSRRITKTKCYGAAMAERFAV